jgi:nucleoredoxin
MYSLLGKELLNKELIIPIENLNNVNIIGLYFSGSHCPPCQTFTPILINLYNELKSLNKNIEIIFISSDKDIDSFKLYYEKMPWLALPYKHRHIKHKLCNIFNIKIIPQLIFINNDLDIVDIYGKQMVETNNINTIIKHLNLD